MLSDWHIGSGFGRPGDVDRLMRRDANGLPFIPAKTLTGIWRDACETVAHGLDRQETDGNWQRLVSLIFGDQTNQRSDAGRPDAGKNSHSDAPRPALLSIRAARYPLAIRRAILSKPRLKESVTFIKPGMMIDPRTGQAKNQFLRFEEMGRKGTILSADVHFHYERICDEVTQQSAMALLMLSARYVERLGGKRRRGAGKCAFTLDGIREVVSNEDLADWVNANLASQFSDAVSPSASMPVSVAKQGSGDWVRIGLRLTTLTPLIIPRRTVGNLVRSLDYLPGTYLLPYISRQLPHPAIGAAIRCGDLIATNATLCIDNQPGLPVPFNLYGRKLDGGLSKGKGVINRFQEVADGPQIKPERDGYISQSQTGKLPGFKRTSLTVETHNVIDDKFQRPTSEVGGVYTYESISEGSTFIAELRFRQSLVELLNREYPEWLRQVECNDFRIGRASKDDYGLVRITQCEIEGSPVIPAEEIPQHLSVWLLADLLIRNKRLRPSTSISDFASQLGSELGVDLELRDSSQAGIMDCAQRSNRIAPWHRGWGLPRPSLVGLAAGSSFIFKISKLHVSPTEYAAKLRSLAIKGFGERRAEGYGQMAFNVDLLTEELSTLTSNSGSDTNYDRDNELDTLGNWPTESPAADVQLRQIELAAWRKEIKQKALSISIDPQFRSDKFGMILNQKPSSSQWGAFRGILSQAQHQEDLKFVIKWLDHIAKSSNRAKDWEKASKLLRRLINDPKEIWSYLFSDPSIVFSELTVIPNGEDQIKKELEIEAIRILLDACIRANKREQEKSKI